MDTRRVLNGPVRALVLDVGAPVVVYYPLRAFGVSTLVALAVAGGVAVLRVAYVGVRHRRFDGVAALMAGVFGIGLVLTLITGDPRVMLAKDSVVTGAAGLVFLGSCLIRRPIMYALIKRILPGSRRAEAEERWRTEPGYRRTLTLMSAVWGGILLTEAVVRVVLVYSLPVDVMFGFSQVIQFAAIGLAIVWTAMYGGRLKRRAALAAAAR